METLRIQNFGGLTDVRIEVAPITVFIGPQATGKSIVSKLLYFFREVILKLDEFAAEGASAALCKDAAERRFTRYFPPSAWGEGVATIAYARGEHRLTISVTEWEADEEQEARLGWGKTFRELFAEHEKRIGAVLQKPTDDSDEESELHNIAMNFSFSIEQWLGASGVIFPQFIPAGRAFFSQVQATIFRTLEADAEIDPFLISFGAMLERSRNQLRRRGFYGKNRLALPKTVAEWVAKTLPFLRAAMAKILRAELEVVDKLELLAFADGRRTRLAQASSGQQEVFPLLILLCRFALQPPYAHVGLHIEEPEAHLFPTTQRDVVEMLAEVFGLQEGKMSVVITTHSPYILTALNNLLQAGRRYDGADAKLAKRLEAIVPRRRALQPGSVRAYAMEGGEAREIMDAETGLIDAAMIDGVSNELAVQFDRLLWEE